MRIRGRIRKSASLVLMSFTVLLVSLPIASLPAGRTVEAEEVPASIETEPTSTTLEPESELISLNKPATSSGLNAAMANDEDATNGGGYFDAVLDGSRNAWWQVDLEGAYRITKLINRNYVDGRSYHYYVRTSLDGENWSTPIAMKNDGVPAKEEGETYVVDTIARYVRVNLTYDSANDSVHITDFKAYGYPVELPAVSPVEVRSVAADQPAYGVGDEVKLAYSIANAGSGTVTVDRLTAKIYGLSRPYFLEEQELGTGLELTPGQEQAGGPTVIWTVPAGASKGAYGVFLRWKLSDGTAWESFETFFRIADEGDLLAYRIDEADYEGFPIYKLDGGMSAEYAVQKAGEALGRTVSPSWATKSPGHGPREVYSSPDFLIDSVQRTVDFYDEQFGADTPFDTVFISTGVAAMPYMARTMKAPILPLQYLASVDTVKELELILDQARQQGMSAYSTLGHDGSVDIGVAWVKLLDLPPAYQDFLVRHGVENVVFMGSNGTQDGENLAKKVIRNGASSPGTHPGEIYVMYPYGGTSTDIDNLSLKIKDFADVRLAGEFSSISDWESGVIQEQIDAFGASIRSGTGVEGQYFVTANAYYNLYEYATFATLAFYKKNEALLAQDGPVVTGVALNPYLLSHPFYESTRGEVPTLFFQLEPMGMIVDGRVNTTVRNAIHTYFPNVVFEDLTFSVNTTRNFGGFVQQSLGDALRSKGLTNVVNADANVDEVWEPADGMNAPAEKFAEQWGLAGTTPQDLADWDNSLQPLTVQDLMDITINYPSVYVIPLTETPSGDHSIRSLKVDGIAVTVVLNDPTATVHYNGVAGSNGISQQVALANGEKSVKITVTAKDGSKQDYVLSIVEDRPDGEAPVTEATVVGTEKEGWYTGDVRVMLAAKSGIGGPAITEYSLDDGATWLGYTEPIALISSGIHRLKYRSRIGSGATETVRSLTVPVDNEAPVYVMEANGILLRENSVFEDGEPLLLTLRTEDGHSGVVRQSAFLDGKSYAPGTLVSFAGKLGTHEIRIIVADKAGNAAEATLRFRVATSPESIAKLLDAYAADKSLAKPLRNELLNDVKQARHQLDKGSPRKAAKEMDSFLKDINDKKAQKQVTPEAKAALTKDARYLIELWTR